MWRVVTLSQLVDDELEALSDDLLARLRRIVELIQNHGLERMREPHVKHIEGPLWEIRLIGRDGIARVIYVTARGQKVVLVRAFMKKTQKTPRHEIVLALKRAQEVL